MGNQIFISYRRKDGFYPAYLLYKELIAENFSVFLTSKVFGPALFPTSFAKTSMTVRIFY